MNCKNCGVEIQEVTEGHWYHMESAPCYTPIPTPTHYPNKETWTIVHRSDSQVTVHAMCICGEECGWVTTAYSDQIFDNDGFSLKSRTQS